jgi:hypothetical protein
VPPGGWWDDAGDIMDDVEGEGKRWKCSLN